jgi:competence protein ComEC
MRGRDLRGWWPVCPFSWLTWRREVREEVAAGTERAAHGGGDAVAWVAAWLWAGIVLWFLLPGEGNVAKGVLQLALAAAMGALWWMGERRADIGGPAVLLPLLRVMLPVVVMLAGHGWMALRAGLVETVVLPANAGMAEVRGRVAEVWMAGARRARLIIDVSRLPKVRAAYRPQRIRLTLRMPAGGGLAGNWNRLPLPGDEIGGRFLLRRLPGPVAPGAHDPRPGLWFAGIGAVGHGHFSQLSVLSRECADCGLLLRLRRLLEQARRRVAGRIAADMEDPHAAGLALALLTGTRNALPAADREALRTAGLAHILAISGLHLAMVAGGVFWAVRALLAALPPLALMWPIRRVAAVAALLAALAYMLLSGNSVATQRAFIMLAIATLAVMLERPAITMRNLGVAAVIILLLWPQVAMTAGFQMSFAAVMALVAVWEAVAARARRRMEFPKRGNAGKRHRLLVGPGRALLALVVSTLVAGMATLLPAVWHFQHLAPWGLAGNLVALPVLSVIVMPLGLAGLMLMPLGLEGPFWAGMEAGLALILEWSRLVAALPGARAAAPAISPLAAWLAAAGMIWLCLRRDRLRLAGALLMVLAVLWPSAPAPEVLVDAESRLVAARDVHGRLVPLVLSGRGSDYVLSVWLRRDGDTASPKEALGRPGWSCAEGICRFDAGAWRVLALPRISLADGKTPQFRKAVAERERALAERVCDSAGEGDVIIAAFPLRRCFRRGVMRVDRFDTWCCGAHALYREENGRWRRIAVDGRRERAFPWARPPLPRREVLQEDGGSSRRGG